MKLDFASKLKDYVELGCYDIHLDGSFLDDPQQQRTTLQFSWHGNRGVLVYTPSKAQIITFGLDGRGAVVNRNVFDDSHDVEFYLDDVFHTLEHIHWADVKAQMAALRA